MRRYAVKGNHVKRFFSRQGIRGKIITGYTAIFILASILGGMITYFQVKKNITENIQNELKNSTSALLNVVRTAASVSVKNYLRAVGEKNREAIQAMYERYKNDEISEDEAKAEARRLIFSQSIGETGYIYCTNSQGIPVVHFNPDVVFRADWADRPFVHQMIRIKQGYLEYDWKNPGEDKFRPKAMYISYFEPWDWIIAVSTYTEELKGLINVNDFRQSVLALKFGETGYSYIIDGQGTPIIHPTLEGNRRKDIASLDRDDFTSEIVRQKTGQLIYSWKNSEKEVYRKKIVIFNHIPEYDWIVASSGYFDEFYSILDTVKKIIVLSILIMIGCALMTSVWLSRLIIEPLNRLMARLDMGVPENLSTRMPITSIDEIGKLVAYYNGFMEKLQTYSDSLKKEISEHRVTSEALMESEWRYRTILKYIYEGYFETNPEGRIEFHNHSMALLTGYSKQELSGKNILDLTSPKDKDRMARLFNGPGIKENNGGIHEWELIRKNNTPCFVETSLSIMVNNLNRQTGIRGVVRDVTQRVQAQKALQLSEEMFSKAFQCSPSGMFLSELKGGRLLNVNDSFLAFTGYEAKDVLGKNLLDLNFFKTRKEGKKLQKLIFEKEGLRNLEIEFCRANGEIRDGIISAEVLQIWGETCILTAIEDCTEARQMERRFQDITERQRQEIVFALHDDLCPQLIGIEMLITILKQKMKPTLPEHSSSLSKIEQLIHDSIKKTRLLSRGLCPVDINQQSFDDFLLELTGYVEDMFGIICKLSSDHSAPFKDNTAATHAYYIVHEAIHNAVKHADADRIFIYFATRHDKTILIVKDNGRGIVKNPDSKGLGLKIMEYRARRLNGSLNIRPSVRCGTIVMLEMELSKNTIT